MAISSLDLWALGMEMGLPELVRSHGVNNPALRSSDQDSSVAHVAGDFGAQPFFSDQDLSSYLGNYTRDGLQTSIGLEFSANPKPYALSLSTRSASCKWRSTNAQTPDYVYQGSMSQFNVGIGFRVNDQWDLGASLNGIQYNTELDSLSVPFANYWFQFENFAFNLYSRYQASTWSLDFRLIPYQSRHREYHYMDETVSDGVNTRNWFGPIGFEAALERDFRLGQRSLRLGFLPHVEIPMDSDDDPFLTAGPYLSLPLGHRSSAQMGAVAGVRNGDPWLDANLGLDCRLWRGFFASTAAGVQYGRLPLDKNAGTRVELHLGLGWQFATSP